MNRCDSVGNTCAVQAHSHLHGPGPLAPARSRPARILGTTFRGSERDAGLNKTISAKLFSFETAGVPVAQSSSPEIRTHNYRD